MGAAEAELGLPEPARVGDGRAVRQGGEDMKAKVDADLALHRRQRLTGDLHHE
jgi:hypothetical protein